MNPSQSANNGSHRNILVVGPAWVGDMVMAHSLFQLLRQGHPDTAIDVLAPLWTRPLLQRMPEVREPLEAPFRHGQWAFGSRHRLGRRLESKNYDQAIVLPNSWKSALVPFFAHIPQRTGFIGEQRWGLLNDTRRLDHRQLPMTVQRFVALARPASATPLPADEIPPPGLIIDPDAAVRTRQQLGLGDNHAPILVLCPGAEYGPAKRWPIHHYATVAKRKQAEGWQVWLLGSARDKPHTAAVQQHCPGAQDLAGRTNLDQVIDLLSLAELVVTNDSGLMHVAAALDRPTVAVYGSSDPRHTPPLSSKAKALWLHLDCSPCFERECPLHHTNCLNQIGPDQVLHAAAALLR